MTTTIRVENLEKRFVLHNQGGLSLPVFERLNFEARAGEALVLYGQSGVGKSTLLRMLFGNYRPTDGAIHVQHDDRLVDIVQAPPRTMLDVRRRSMNFVSQFLRVIPRVSTLEIVKDRMLARGVEDRIASERAKTMLGRLNLPQRLWSLAPSTFSGGEQQRVNIARSFVDPAPILLLDEPTASLDAVNRDVVVDLINEARSSGRTIVGIFHDELVRNRVATRHLDLGLQSGMTSS